MSAEQVVASLLRIASEDLAGARQLAASGNRNAAYLCEQAAEKVIRAVLTTENVHGGVRHQLDAMVALVPDENPLKPALKSIEHLGDYATAFRYPTSSGRITPGPTEETLRSEADKVEAILLDVARRLGVDLAARTPAARATPIR
jgi:HEPN domain-containing protein